MQITTKTRKREDIMTPKEIIFSTKAVNFYQSEGFTDSRTVYGTGEYNGYACDIDKFGIDLSVESYQGYDDTTAGSFAHALSEEL